MLINTSPEVDLQNARSRADHSSRTGSTACKGQWPPCRLGIFQTLSAATRKNPRSVRSAAAQPPRRFHGGIVRSATSRVQHRISQE